LPLSAAVQTPPQMLPIEGAGRVRSQVALSALRTLQGIQGIAVGVARPPSSLHAIACRGNEPLAPSHGTIVTEEGLNCSDCGSASAWLPGQSCRTNF